MKNLYKNKKVLIFGLGLNDGGVGMAEFFLKQGAKVTITDSKSKKELGLTLIKLKKYEKNITYHLGKHYKKDFKEADIVVRNPAIPPNNEYLRLAKKHNKEIVMEISLFLKLFRGTSVGVTGTKGKSTTTTLIYEILKHKFKDRVVLGGNIGKSVIRELPNLSKQTIAVLEISSFQLESMGENKISPNISVITNIYQDHINWHGSVNKYVKAKKCIFKYQKAKDICVLNIDNKKLSGLAKKIPAKVIKTSKSSSLANFYIKKNLHVSNTKINLKNIKLKGEHNKNNILEAIAVAKTLKVPEKTIQKVLNEFTGVEGRQQFIREIRGVKFYNDTTATNLEAISAALESFGKEYKKKIVMISGGVDKGLDYKIIKRDIEKYVREIVLLQGTASEKIYEVLKNTDIKNTIYKYYDNFEKAIKKAYGLASKGDMVILCPGAASFNMFINEFDRGKKFNEIVKKLK
ncbi:UDP-N-acetylmuramoyl-L-alanine--D-glutamate ligase [candidate division WWE3 bacterium CG10_big_fil_rev_8_21_14_0_10_32_10]|uniref:UDP-N-acetylmuramoylalanine--D-glutamate ligase n=1 Tax=candidate division WWE3 bacterium CG10_big_fil_rev_8_21_14_0_10_32_10 TaxID=1975090 RepID=A0A2H0RAU7_UNCKA|nr:MAG: UDP-N-acetylmuramoyl-L-alanine--D-glutamate ligase [candidate division WWE3 bacterium CG10_big_fil_rev_8_21_14_0_10_32_10]